MWVLCGMQRTSIPKRRQIVRLYTTAKNLLHCMKSCLMADIGLYQLSIDCVLPFRVGNNNIKLLNNLLHCMKSRVISDIKLYQLSIDCVLSCRVERLCVINHLSTQSRHIVHTMYHVIKLKRIPLCLTLRDHFVGRTGLWRDLHDYVPEY